MDDGVSRWYAWLLPVSILHSMLGEETTRCPNVPPSHCTGILRYTGASVSSRFTEKRQFACATLKAEGTTLRMWPHMGGFDWVLQSGAYLTPSRTYCLKELKPGTQDRAAFKRKVSKW